MTDAGLALPLRLAGGVWGHLVGDAMGVPYEFREPESVGEVRFGATGSHHQPPGTWSDDGALMLALLDSLTDVGFDTDDQGRRALAWWNDGAYTPDGTRFDWGSTTSEALRAIERGTPAEQAGPTHEQSQSNGSLMRILPLALWAHAERLDGVELADGIELRRHPVVDMDVPTDRAAYRATLDGLTAAIRAGRSVVVACRGGLGRTGTAVACLLVGEGMDPEEAIGLTRASRRKTIERGVQVEWVRGWRSA